MCDVEMLLALNLIVHFFATSNRKYILSVHWCTGSVLTERMGQGDMHIQLLPWL